MAETIMLPKLGFDMREGTFLNWIKKVGDSVNKGDVLAEIESDKATIEVESTASGVVLQTLVKEGDVVPVGDPIAIIGAAGESSGAAPVPVPVPAQTPAPTPATPPVESAESVGNAPSTATPAPTPAPVAAAPVAAPALVKSEPVDEDLPDGVKASPVARKVAEERGLDLTMIKGSGPNGRITKQDVEGYVVAPAPVAAPIPVPASPPAAPVAPPPAATVTPAAMVLGASTIKMPPIGPGMTEMPMSRLRQRIATRLIESKQTIPHFYVTSEIEMDAALALRKQVNETLDDAHKITVNDLIVKATAVALRQFPQLNSHYYGDKLIRYDYINIGLAVALDAGGLMNVVAKNADLISMSMMAARNKELIAAARSGKVKPEDVEGSTFTTSNLGPYEVDQFVAIINPPEAGIIAVGSAKQIPVIVNGEVKVATRMKATLSADHRVTDGAEAAQFMQLFKKLLETPMRIIV